MVYPLSKFLSALLAFTLVLTSGAQQMTPLSKREAAIKHKTDSLAAGAHISVIRFHEDEAFGNFASNNQEGFTFHDVDLNADVTLKYAEVKKIKDGYGGFNFATQRHVDRTKNFVIVAIVVGALGAVIAAAAMAKN
jgi:hypothetical protein